jgi:DNA-binding XRE family transcriptional regulator/DNA-binding CsgD family transcriptional regulator
VSAPVQVGPSPQGVGPTAFPDWDELLADIGDRIRAERQARGWSQRELGKRTGVALATVKRLEAGESSLLITFAMACRAMDVDMGHLLSVQWRMPERHLALSPMQARVLAVVADGCPLAEAARVLGSTPTAVASVLTGTYRRLGVADVPRGQRRAAAVRVARARGLIVLPNRTS